ncbi:MAG: hypothetical protein P8Y60_15235 [Calditrichota bacterium]
MEIATASMPCKDKHKLCHPQFTPLGHAFSGDPLLPIHGVWMPCLLAKARQADLRRA